MISDYHSCLSIRLGERSVYSDKAGAHCWSLGKPQPWHGCITSR